MKKLLLPLLLGLIMLGAGCEKNGIEPEKGKADAFKGRFLTLEVPQTAGIGEPVKIKVDITPSVSAPPYELEWDIDPKLADFDKTTNTLTRKANGPVTVKVNVKGYPDIWASRTINPIIATNISFKKRTHNVEVGQSVTVDVEVTPNGADTDFEWKLNNSNASFDEKTRTLTLNNPDAAELTVSIKGKPELTDECLIKHPNTVYFFDKNFREYILYFFDTNKNGSIEQSEAESVKKLFLTSKKIKSLDGIEFLPNLEELICNDNNINEIDISKNTKLKIFNCCGNNLSTIDVSRNPNLANLSCNRNNLSTIDVSKNPNLTNLICAENKLSIIDIQNNLKLEEIYCTDNQLSSINLNNNKELKYLHIDNNKISNIDLSNNKKLKYLECSYNKLSSLSLSHLSELLVLNFSNNNLPNIDITKNIYLYYLDCSNNHLSNIDITNNIILQSIYCGNNKITSIDITKCIDLYCLDCYNNNLSSIDISNCTKLFKLNCGTNSISAIDLSNNIKLNILYCFDNKLSSIDIKKCTDLTSISITGNNLTSIDISNNTKLEYAGFNNNPNLYKIFVWKGFTPRNMFQKDDKAIYVEVSE